MHPRKVLYIVSMTKLVTMYANMTTINVFL